MNRRQVLCAGASAAALSLIACAPQTRQTPKPPVARKEPKTMTQVGRTRVDEYAWLKDDKWQEVLRDPKVLRADIRTHLVTENTYFDTLMSDSKPLQEKMFAEMKGRVKEDDASAPKPHGAFEYYSRFNIGAQHPIYARKPRGGAGAEEILLDVDAQAKGKAFYQVSATGHSEDHALFAYAEDDKGAGIYRIHVRDAATGKPVGAPIESSNGNFEFSPDNQWIFWTYQDANARPVKVFRRPARGGADVLVYEEKDPGMFLGVGLSESRAFILVQIGNQETSEVRVIDAKTPTAAPKLFAPRVVGQLYTPVHFDGRWYVLTNADGAVDFKIVTAELGATDRNAWRTFIPHTPGRYIESLTAAKGHLVRLERSNALPRVVIRDVAGQEHGIEQKEAAFALALDPGFEFDTPVVRYVYQSPTTPRQWIDYDMTARTNTVRKTQEIPSGHDPARYVAERFSIKAKDGAEIPVTVLKLRATPVNASAPLLLYGYGSYGFGMEADFGITRFSLVDRGWIWVIAHVRGGNERGRGWFEDGRKKKKMNTFTDFIAVAEGLVERRYAARGRIVSYGGSAGGLLVGAVSNLASEGLFGGHIAAVPFVDVINTMSDATLPLTPPEWPEWGNPLESAEDYDTMAAYSPYDNVAAKAYPPIFAHGGVTDSRVTYWEPAKWIARLRDRAPAAGPYLLHINLEAGHGGASGRFNRLKEVARDLAFAMKALGEKEAGAPLR